MNIPIYLTNLALEPLSENKYNAPYILDWIDPIQVEYISTRSSFGVDIKSSYLQNLDFYLCTHIFLKINAHSDISNYILHWDISHIKYIKIIILPTSSTPINLLKILQTWDISSLEFMEVTLNTNSLLTKKYLDNMRNILIPDKLQITYPLCMLDATRSTGAIKKFLIEI